MKRYTSIFDVFLLESIFVFLFACLLYFIKDPLHSLLFKIAAISGFITILIGIVGYQFKLFRTKHKEEF